MHSNEMLSVKVRFEILYGVNLDDKIFNDGKETTLGKLISE